MTSLTQTQLEAAKKWLTLVGAVVGALLAIVAVGGALRYLFGGQGYAFLLTGPALYGLWWAWHSAWQSRRLANIAAAQLVYAQKGQRIIRVNWAKFVAYQDFQVIDSTGRLVEDDVSYADIQKTMRASTPAAK